MALDQRAAGRTQAATQEVMTMGRMQRVKGQVFERLIARAFKQVFPGAKRGIGQARSSSEVADVEVPLIWPECKHGKLPNVRAALAQAIEAAAKSGRIPVAVIRDNQREPFVVLRFGDFLHVIAALVVAQGGGMASDLDLPAWAEAKREALDRVLTSVLP